VQGEHHNHECHASRTIKKDADLDAELDIAKETPVQISENTG
jgi:hypothetical protein